MTDLAGLAKRMRDLGRRVVIGSSALVKETAIAIDQAVVVATPVDTGRARGNWVVGIGSPVRSTTEDTDPSGQETINRNNQAISGALGGREIYISNNLPYISALNNGTSAQAPAGFVEQAVAVGVDTVRRKKILRS